MSLYVSLLILAVAIFLARRVASEIVRTYFALAVLGWAGLLLTLYMEALVRAAARQVANPQSTDLFYAGILAYKNVLGEIRISMGLLVISLAVLILFPSRFGRSKAPRFNDFEKSS